MHSGLTEREPHIGSNESLGARFRVHFWHFIHRFDERVIELAEYAICSCAPKLALVLEMISDQGVVDARPIGDVPGRGTLEAILGKSLSCGVKQLLLRNNTALLLFALRLRLGDCLLGVQNWPQKVL